MIVGLAHALGFASLVQVRLGALQEAAGMALLAVVFASLATLTLVPALLEIRQEGGLAAWWSAGLGED